MSKYKLAPNPQPVEKPIYLQTPFIGAVVIGVVGMLTFLVLSVLAAPKSNFVPEFTGGGRAVVDKTFIDFGDVKYEQPVLAEFKVRNVGDKPLNILDDPYIEVVEGCCASPVRVGTQVLQPGEETIVSTTFSMHEGMGGKHNFSLHLVTDDVVEPHHELTILSNWVP